MKMNRAIIILFSLFCFSYSYAQNIPEYQKHEFSVGVLAGIPALDFDLTKGSSTSKFSGGIGVGYTYFFSKSMGLATGVDFVFYNAELAINDFESSQQAFEIDIQRDFEFRYTLQNYKEKQNAFYLNIPIMLHYQFTNGKKVKFYGAAGVKAGLPINGRYKSSEGDLKTAGYFPHNEDLIDDIPFRGFGEFKTKEYSSEVKYKLSLSLALEGGAKWTLPKEMALYTGLYLDYGLNNVNQSSEGDLSLVQYNQMNPQSHILNGVAKSSVTPTGGVSQRLVEKVKTMSYGVKIRLAFGR